MNKPLILALIAALGATSTNAWAENPDTGEVTIKDFNYKSLHPETIRVLAKLRATNAIHLVSADGKTELRIDPSRVPDDLLARLQVTENAQLDNETGEYVLTESLSAAIAASGELDEEYGKTEEGQVSIESLIDNVGDRLEESVLMHGYANLM